MSYAEIAHRFTYHPPKDAAQVAVYETNRSRFRDLAVYMESVLPESREKSIVLTKLEEALMWANAAVARG